MIVGGEKLPIYHPPPFSSSPPRSIFLGIYYFWEEDAFLHSACCMSRAAYALLQAWLENTRMYSRACGVLFILHDCEQVI